MGIISLDDDIRPSLLQDYAASKMDVFKNAFEGSVADNPFSKFLQSTVLDDINTQQDNPDKYPNSFHEKRYSRQEADAYAKETAGVSLNNVPDNIPETALHLIVERQYQKKRREELANSNPNASITNFTGNLAGSLTDPLNVAASFIPFVGEARYASLLEGASGPVSRALVRGAVGAAEGAGGAAVLEPLNYTTSRKLGDDYDFSNSLTNVAMGGVMGGGLHMAIGAAGDFVSKGGFGKKIESLPFAAREDMLKAAVSQTLEGKNVNIEPILQLHEQSRLDQIDNIKLKMRDAFENSDSESFNNSNQKLESLQSPTDINGEKIPEEYVSESVDKDKALSDLRDKNLEDTNAKFVDQNLIEKHQAEVENNPERNLTGTPDEELALQTERTNEAIQSLNDKFEKMGVDSKPIFEEADARIKEASDFEKAVKQMAICAARGER